MAVTKLPDPRGAPITKENPFGFTEEEWRPDSTPNDPFGEKPMSNKFLPFIVDSSTPKHIFKTLMSRSKGMNTFTIASIFNLTLNIDIKKLRNVVKEMAEMPLETLYQELIQKFPVHAIDDKALKVFHGMSDFMNASQTEDGWWTDELGDFEKLDVMTFLCVVSMKGVDMSDYTKFNFTPLHEFTAHLVDFKEYITFSDEGAITQFDNEEQLKNYIVFCAVLKPQISEDGVKPFINAVIKSQKVKNDGKSNSYGEDK